MSETKFKIQKLTINELDISTLVGHQFLDYYGLNKENTIFPSLSDFLSVFGIQQPRSIRTQDNVEIKTI
jgi:hypothetical protein